MTSDESGTAVDAGGAQIFLRWIGVPAAMGKGDETGPARRGCGCARLVLVAGGVLMMASLLVEYFAFALWGVAGSAGFFAAGAFAALFAQRFVTTPTVARRMQIAGKVGLGFGTACLLGVFVVMIGLPGDVQVDTRVDPTGGTIGPITVVERTWVTMEVAQSIEGGSGTFQRWSFVTAELLDKNKEYLASFGGEFWHYAGYDDGYWNQADETYSATLLIPSPGTYYVKLSTESNVEASLLEPVHVEMQDRAWWGNPGPLRTAAYVAFFLGAVLVVAPWVGRDSRVRTLLDSGNGTVTFKGRTWRVRGRTHYEYESWRADEWTLHPTDPGATTPRYLEHEYEEAGDWENWAWSRPIEVMSIRKGEDAGSEAPDLRRYVEQTGGFPEHVTFDDRTYTLEDEGTVRSAGQRRPYRTYKARTGDFLALEGDRSDTLSAFAGTSIQLRDVSVAEDGSAPPSSP